MPRRVWPAWVRPSAIVDLLRLATPIAISRASMMLMGLTDTIILSQNAAGELPYILNSWFPIGIFLGMSMGLLLGVSILTAEMSGRGDRKNTGRIFRRGMYISLVFGGVATALVWFTARPLFTLLKFDGELLDGTVSATRILALGLIAHMISNTAGSYLEALRRPTIVTVAMYVGVLINLIIDLAFVAGALGLPKIGADGVAIATSGTRWLLAVALIGLVFWFTPGFKASEPGPKGEGKHLLQLGYGMAASNVAEWGSFNFTFVIATWVSTFSGTVYGMVIHTLGFIFMGFLGIGTATSVRVAEAVGQENPIKARTAARTGVVTSIVFGLMGCCAMLFGAEFIARIFIQTDEMLDGRMIFPVLSAMIAFTAIVVVFDGLQNVASMASRALGSVWPPSIIHIGCYVGGMLPLAWFFGISLGRGLQGVVEGVIIASMLAGIIQLVFLEYLCFRKKSEESGR
jgi:MATE family multidrug resistance protein